MVVAQGGGGDSFLGPGLDMLNITSVLSWQKGYNTQTMLALKTESFYFSFETVYIATDFWVPEQIYVKTTGLFKETSLQAYVNIIFVLWFDGGCTRTNTAWLSKRVLVSCYPS